MKSGARLGSDKIGLLLLIFIMLLIPLGLSNPYHYDLAIKMALNATVTVGLNLLIGYAGQISLGHASFFAIGAYASALLPQRYHVDGLLAIGVGATMAGLLAWLVARPILRLRGHYLAMATLGLGIIFSIVLTQEGELTGGPDGITVPTFSAFGHELDNPKVWYAIIAIVLIAVVFMSLNLIRSAFGRGLRALGDSETAAETAGLDIASMKTRVFVLSAVIAAVAGSLFANTQHYVTPEEAGFVRSIELVTMVVVGGMASTFGAVIGAALLTFLPQALTGFPEWHDLIFGVILSVFMIFIPRGLVPSLHQYFKDKHYSGANRKAAKTGCLS